jgi:hypothetical protein
MVACVPEVPERQSSGRRDCSPMAEARLGIAVAMHQFVIGEDTPIRERRSRGQLAKKVLPQAIHWMSELERFYRIMLFHEDANRIASEVRLAKERLARVSSAFDTKHLGTSRRWELLAMVEGYVFEATHALPTAAEIVELITAARFALGGKPEPWDTEELVSKGLRKFKENNPDKSVLWTNPSSHFRATAVPLSQKRS